MKTKRTKACVVEALFRTSFCTKTSTRFCTECGLALKLIRNLEFRASFAQLYVYVQRTPW